MATTYVDPLVDPGPSLWVRARRRGRGLWARLSTMARAGLDRLVIASQRGWAWTKVNSVLAYRWARAHTVSAAMWTWALGRTGVNLLLRGVGFVGSFAASVISAVITGIASAFGMIGSAAFLVILGVCLVLFFINGYWDDYVVESGRWLRKKDRGSYRAHIAAARAARLADAGEPVDFAGYTHPETVMDEKNAWHDRLAVTEMESTHPGVRPVIVNDGDASDPNALFEPDFAPLKALAAWVAENEAADRITPAYEEFSWIEVIEDPDLLKTYQWLRDTTDFKKARSYWEGRIRMLQAYREDPSVLEEHTKVWALAHAQLRNNDAVHLKSARTGYMEMADELVAYEQMKKQPAKAGR